MRLAVLALLTTLAWFEVGRFGRLRVLALALVLIAAAVLARRSAPRARAAACLLLVAFALAMLADYAAWPSPPDPRMALGLLATVAVAVHVGVRGVRGVRPVAGLALSAAVLASALLGAEWHHRRTRPTDPYAIVGDSPRGPRRPYRPDPELEMKFRPGFTGYFVHPQYARQRVVVNGAGFRGRDWPAAPDPGTVGVLLLGDSMLFGMGAEEDETIAAHLELGLAAAFPGRRFQVFNASVPGYGPRHELAMLVREYPRLAPAVCLALFNDGNDLEDCRRQFVESRRAGLHAGLLRSEERVDGRSFRPPDVFVSPGGAGVPPLWTRIYWVRYSALARDLDQLVAGALVRWGWTPLSFSYNHELLRAMRRTPDLEVEEEFRLAGEAFQAMDEACRAGGTVFGIVRLPGLLQSEPAAYARLITELGRRTDEFARELPGARVGAEAAARGIPVLDLLPEFAVTEREQCVWFYREGHPNPRGNRKLAESILRWLTQDARFSGALVR